MTGSVLSVNKLPIRLTAERWSHITEEHSELAGMKLEVLDVVADPVRIVEGRQGELLAHREIVPGKHIVVVYREEEEDGFVITAFLTTRTGYLDRRRQAWPSSE